MPTAMASNTDVRCPACGVALAIVIGGKWRASHLHFPTVEIRSTQKGHLTLHRTIHDCAYKDGKHPPSRHQRAAKAARLLEAP
jgi:hypothetical protein